MFANNPEYIDKKFSRAGAREADQGDLESRGQERRWELSAPAGFCVILQSSIATLSDLGLSRQEIAAYLHRFGYGTDKLSDLQVRKSSEHGVNSQPDSGPDVRGLGCYPN
jgi:hypothetical protein